MEIISLTVLTRRGVAVNQVQLIDVDDIAAPIQEVTPGGFASFTLRELKKGPFASHNTNTGIQEYTTNETLAQIAVLAGSIFTVNILTYKGRTRSAFLGFNAEFITGTIIPFAGGSKFYYQEDSDPDLVEYTCRQTPAAILAQITSNSVPPVSTVPIGDSVFVSDETGNDATGLRERFDKMFKTVEAAQAVAISGDTIFVYPGTYTPAANLGKNGVNWHLHTGAILNGTNSFNDAGGMTFKISGGGKLSGTNVAIAVTNAASFVTVEGIEMVSNHAGAICSISAAGTLSLRNIRMESLNNTSAGNGINIGAGLVILNGVTIVLTHAAAKSLFATAPQNVKIYSAYANRDVSVGNITNLISGTVLYYDTNVQ